MTPFLALHIVFGTLSLTSAVAAIVLRKRSTGHIFWGRVFVVTMVGLTLTGGVVAYNLDQKITMMVSALTLHLVLSGWMTALRAKPFGKLAQRSVSTLGLLTLGYSVYLSWLALGGSTDALRDGTAPVAAYITFTAINAFACYGDLHIWLGQRLARIQRLRRHLWRMLMALFITTSSVFSGQRQIFPEKLQESLLLAVPELSVLVVLGFWLIIIFKYHKPIS